MTIENFHVPLEQPRIYRVSSFMILSVIVGCRMYVSTVKLNLTTHMSIVKFKPNLTKIEFSCLFVCFRCNFLKIWCRCQQSTGNVIAEILESDKYCFYNDLKFVYFWFNLLIFTNKYYIAIRVFIEDYPRICLIFCSLWVNFEFTVVTIIYTL